jgi:acyl-coenzyme A thioesterase PaaI-like protein
MSDRLHPNCVVCSTTNRRGLAVQFVPSNGVRAAVEATFDCDAAFQGYEDLVHGGIVCSLLDGAMANCLFRFGRVAHTATLTVRFRHPVLVGRPATVRGWIERTRGRLHLTAAELVQDGQVKAQASAKFVAAPPRSRAGELRPTSAAPAITIPDPPG